MLLENVLQEYLFDCQLRKLSVRTIKSVRNNNQRFFQYLAKEFAIFKLEEVKRVHIQAYVNYLSEVGRKESYINNIIKSFRALFVYCEQEEYIKESPMKKVKFQKEEITLIETFTDDEVRKMISFYCGKTFLDIRNRFVIVLLLDAGIRNSELCDIKMEDLSDSAIRIHGKGKKIRFVPMTPSINKVLLKYLRSREKYIKDKLNYQEEYLFLSQKGKRLTPETVQRVVRDCGMSCDIRNEIRCSPHTFRHYYSQTQLKNGCDIFVVSKLLGHSNINITKRYLNSMRDEDVLEMGQKTSPLRNL